MLFGLGYAEIIPLPWEGVLRGVCLANHLASTDNLTTSNQETEHIKTQTNVNKESGPNKQQHTQKPMLRQRTDTAWFSAFYDIRPGNGVGLFLQPGACLGRWFSKSSTDILVYGMSNQSEFYCSKRRWRWRWWQPVHVWIICTISSQITTARIQHSTSVRPDALLVVLIRWLVAWRLMALSVQTDYIMP